jgi:hypothetical protein
MIPNRRSAQQKVADFPDKIMRQTEQFQEKCEAIFRPELRKRP